MSAVNNSLSARPVNSSLAKTKDEKSVDDSPGKRPYTRSSSHVSIASPHVAGAPGKLGETRVELLGENQMPAHLVGRNSRNELFVAYRVNQHNTGDPKAGVEPSTVPGDDLVTQNEPAPALTTSKFAPEA